MSPLVFLVPVVLQGIAMLFDEGWFHRKRGLPRWERVGHPLDTLTVMACFTFLLVVSPERSGALTTYVALSVFSCLFITKDELVHAIECEPAEQWLHSVLFLLHPVVLGAAGWLWKLGGHQQLLAGQLALSLVFALYQIVYWRFVWSAPPPSPRP